MLLTQPTYHRAHLEEETPITDFRKINLDQLNQVALMNRVDTKYLLSTSQLTRLTDYLRPFYMALEINGNSRITYNNIYFDTPDDIMYLAHHNGQLNRLKIRKRSYHTGQSFLEIKTKNNKGRTHKIRVATTEDSQFSRLENAYIKTHTKFNPTSLVQKLTNQFKRITLVNIEWNERCTIDTDIAYQNQSRSHRLDQVAIIEIKNSRCNKNSQMRLALARLGIKPVAFSKYCMGRIALNPDLKANRFKKRLRSIKKLNTQSHCNKKP